METYITQFQKLWSDLGTNQKASILFAALGVVIGVGALLVWAGRPPMQLLFGRLDPADMAEVLGSLDEQGVMYELNEAGNSVYVSPDKVHALRMKMTNDGLLNGGGVGFEIFDKGNFGISDFVQKTNYVRAVQGELSRTISQLRGVRSARVMIVVPQNRLLLDRTKNHSTASVFVDTAGAKLPQDAINSIRFLVSNAVEGLELNDVAVVDNNGNVLSEEVRTDETIGIASSQLKLRKDLEDYYTNKVESMLSRVIGPGQVVARVSVDLDTQAATIVEEKYDPEGQVVRQQTSNEDSSSSEEATNSQQVVGVAANVPAEEAATGNAGGSTSSNETRKNKSITYEINRTTTETIKRPGSINRISAAVFVAMKFAGEGENLTAEPRTPEEVQRLTAMVANALGVVIDNEGQAVEPNVTIEEVSFMANPLEAAVAGELSSPIFKWLEAGRNFMSVGIAVIMFVIFLKMLKQHKVEPINVEVIEDEVALAPAGATTPGGAINSAVDVTPRPTPELLNDLIQQKPENVGTALKKWMATSK